MRSESEVRAVALFNDAMTAPPPLARNLSDEVFEAVTAPPAPAAARAAEMQRMNANNGKRKMPAYREDLQLERHYDLHRHYEGLGHGFGLPMNDLSEDLQIELAIENSLLMA